MSKKRREDATRSKPLVVLVDMDGVVCDFESYMLASFQQKYPDEPYVLPENRRMFYMSDQYNELKPGLGSKIRELMEAPGFFRNLPEIDGAVNAVKEMSGIDGVEVFLCTTPIHNPLNCVPEKYEWVKEHFGNDWLQRIILARDKTLVFGNIIIDDKHRITGIVTSPSWEHIIFSQCHNKHLEPDSSRFVRRLDAWTDGSWRSLIHEYRKKL